MKRSVFCLAQTSVAAPRTPMVYGTALSASSGTRWTGLRSVTARTLQTTRSPGSGVVSVGRTTSGRNTVQRRNSMPDCSPHPSPDWPYTAVRLDDLRAMKQRIRDLEEQLEAHEAVVQAARAVSEAWEGIGWDARTKEPLAMLRYQLSRLDSSTE